MFPDIEQEVIVFIGEKGEEEKGIRIIEMNDLSGFAQLDLSQTDFKSCSTSRRNGQNIS